MWDFASFNDVAQAISGTYILIQGKPYFVNYLEDGNVQVRSLIEDEVEDYGWEDIKFCTTIQFPENGNYNLFGSHGWVSLHMLPLRQWRKALIRGQQCHIGWPNNTAAINNVAAKAILTCSSEFPNYISTVEGIVSGMITSAALSRRVGVHLVKDSVLLSYQLKYIGVVNSDGTIDTPKKISTGVQDELMELGVLL